MVNKKKGRKFRIHYIPLIVIAVLLGIIYTSIVSRETLDSRSVNITLRSKDELDADYYEDMAKTDLADKLSIPISEIKTVQTEKTEFNDTSLGCPEKNKFYAQVITPGFNITLSAREKAYDYHAGSEKVVICPL